MIKYLKQFRDRMGRAASSLMNRTSDVSRDWTMTRKVVVAFGGVVFAVVLLVVVSGVSLFGVRSAVGNVTALSSADQALLRVESQAAAATGLLKDYVIRPDDALATRVNYTLDQAIDKLDDAEDGASQLNQLAALGQMRQALSEAKASAAKIIAAQHNIQAITHDSLEKLGPQIAGDLRGIKDTAHAAGQSEAMYRASIAEARYYEMRVNVTRYLSDTNPETRKQAKANLLDLEDSMNLLYDELGKGPLVKRADKVIGDFVVYDKAFDAVVAASHLRDTQIDNLLHRAGPKLSKNSQTIVAAIDGMRGRSTIIAKLAVGSALVAVLGAALVCIGLVLLSGAAVHKVIASPIKRLAGQMRALAEREFDTDVDGTERSDEVGEMARAVEIFRANSKEVDERRRAALEAEKRELEREQQLVRQREEERARADAERNALLTELANKFEGTIGQVVSELNISAKQIGEGAQGLSSNFEQSSMLMTDVVAVATQSSANSSQVAAAVEEMSVSITGVLDQMTSAADFAQAASRRARVTDAIVSEMASTAQAIQDIVILVAQIAKQTNLLSLNAAIEASRAGEAGKGFAVVAAEVKNLAAQTSQATMDIQTNIERSIGTSKRAMEAITDIAQSIDEISNIASKVSTAIREQTTTTEHIAQNTHQVAHGSQLTMTNLDDVKRNIDASSMTAREALQAAQSLNTQADALKRAAESFVREVRAG